MNRILRRMKSTLKANLQMSYGMSALMRAVLLSAVLLSAFATAQAPIVTPTQPIGKPMRAASAPAANAKVIAMPAGLDFGVVAPHTLLEGNFKLANTSDKPLKVLGAQPSCQCTTIDITGKEIPA